MNLTHAVSLTDSAVGAHAVSLADGAEGHVVALAAAGPDLPAAAQVVLALVFVLALLSAAARYRRPSSKD